MTEKYTLTPVAEVPSKHRGLYYTIMTEFLNIEGNGAKVEIPDVTAKNLRNGLRTTLNNKDIEKLQKRKKVKELKVITIKGIVYLKKIKEVTT